MAKNNLEKKNRDDQASTRSKVSPFVFLAAGLLAGWLMSKIIELKNPSIRASKRTEELGKFEGSEGDPPPPDWNKRDYGSEEKAPI